MIVGHFLHWIQPILSNHSLAAPFVFIVLHILMAVFFVPCSPMTIMAGALWGGIYGLVISMLAAIFSSATTFLLSRSFLHDGIQLFLGHRFPKMATLLDQTANHDWKIIALSQMNPLMPASTMGYVFGLSRVKFSRYILFSLIFMLPLQLLFVMTGHSLISLIVSDGNWGLAALLATIVVFFILMSKRIYKMLCQFFGVNNGA
jgi:uncharacterized membrane protein YdjX (TVP38/TMEM64 family)